ncbi:MAG: hypothetical protein U5M23_03350 [Marinagarivorans sp.]|nr:hypothetical protein [Marinagarivorans sp.]
MNKFNRVFTCLRVLSFICLLAACSKDKALNVAADSSISSTSNMPIAKSAPPSLKHKAPSLGMGLSGVSDWSSAMPFIDLMKQSREWSNWSGGDANFALDENGWPTELVGTQEAGTVFFVASTSVFSRAIVFYEGDGVINYVWSARKIDDESRPGRDVITLGIDNHLLVIKSTNPKNPIRNIRIIPEPYLASYEKGEIFNPVWLEKIAPFSALRFMDWMATNHSTQMTWAGRPKMNDRTWAAKGVPAEVMVRLANQLMVDPWFNIPHLADKEYMEGFAALLHSTLNSRLTAYVEHSNEVWNWQFEQAQYAHQTGEKQFPKDHNARMQWQGMRTAQICDSFKNEKFGVSVKRIKCVLGVQVAWHGLEKEALSCPDWKEGAPCYKHGFDAIALTGYFDGKLNGPHKNDNKNYSNTLLNWASRGAEGLDLAFEQLNTGKSLNALPEFKDFKGVQAAMKTDMDYWQGVANDYSLALVAYEGGQHITANGHFLQDDPAIIEFHQSINRDPRMKALYLDIFKVWKDNGGGLFMHFVEIGRHSKWGSWGALETFDQLNSPKWDAIVEFNNKEKCWWKDCEIIIEQ